MYQKRFDSNSPGFLLNFNFLWFLTFFAYFTHDDTNRVAISALQVNACVSTEVCMFQVINCVK